MESNNIPPVLNHSDDHKNSEPKVPNQISNNNELNGKIENGGAGNDSEPSTSTSSVPSLNQLRHRGNNSSDLNGAAPPTPNLAPLPPQPQPPILVHREQNVSKSLIFLFLGLVIAFGLGRVLIQFRTEVNLDQLSKRPVSPFKSASIPSSQSAQVKSPPTPKPKWTKPRPVYNDPFGPPAPPEVISVVKDNIELEPEYVEYAQQLKLVLGTLKKAIGRLAENSTEVAGLVKMKPNKEPTDKGEVKLETDHSKLFEDEDEEKKPDSSVLSNLDEDGEEIKTFKIPIPGESQSVEMETDSQREKTIEFRQKSQEPATNPYDAIMDYRKKNAKREEELNDLILNEEPEDVPDSVFEEIEERKEEKDKLMNELIHYFFQNYREGTEDELELQDSFYKDVTESELESIRNRLHDTLFQEPRDLAKDIENNIIYDDGDDGSETVFDEELGMEVKLGVKEELDSLEGAERKFVYDGLKRQFKVEEKIKEGMNKLVQKEKDSESDNN